jgi:hypothetical protein
MKNLLWTFALLVSLVFLAFAYYMKSASVRTAINDRFPWVARTIGTRLPEIQVKTAPAPKTEAIPATGEVAAAVPPAPTVPAAPPEPEIFDLKKLQADRPSWPPKVRINKPTKFPAVVNGKVVGDLVAPAGTEVGLNTISGGKLGVEYQGGGAWLFVEETDIIARTGKRPN